MQVRFPPEMGQQCHVSRRVDQGISGFSSSLFHKAFPRGFSTGLSHVPTWCESILGLKLRQCREYRFPWNGLRSLGDYQICGTPWSSARLSCGERLLLECDGRAGNSFPTTQGKNPPIELGGGNGAPLDVGGTLVLRLEWRRVCRGTS